ncbi:MAG TPA: caspase family protein [Thermoanaerobaculia bacterium]|nr:caspase family protein [Thermoanaerobaculia bacterium]
MPKGLSLHIGLNTVDTSHYGNVAILKAAENDPVLMETIARNRGFETKMLIGSNATTEAVKEVMNEAAGQLVGGDIFLLTYAGHGSQVPDRNGDEAENSNVDDAEDETWCLFDRMLVDDELYALWAAFAPGVRIAMFSDSCHSGTIARTVVVERVNETIRGNDEKVIIPGAPRILVSEQAMEIYAAHQEAYDAIQTTHAEGIRIPIKASVILISACQDNQLAGDGNTNGAFTTALKIRWGGGSFAGSYDTFRKKIGGLLPVTQSPNYFVIGAPNPDFEKQTPFTI